MWLHTNRPCLCSLVRGLGPRQASHRSVCHWAGTLSPVSQGAVACGCGHPSSSHPCPGDTVSLIKEYSPGSKCVSARHANWMMSGGWERKHWVPGTPGSKEAVPRGRAGEGSHFHLHLSPSVILTLREPPQPGRVRLNWGGSWHLPGRRLMSSYPQPLASGEALASLSGGDELGRASLEPGFDTVTENSQLFFCQYAQSMLWTRVELALLFYISGHLSSSFSYTRLCKLGNRERFSLL